MVAGMLPLAAALAFVALAFDAVRQYGESGQHFTLARLCLIAYAFALLMLLPCVGRLAWLSRHGHIVFTPRRQSLVTVAVVMLIAPPVVLGALPLIA